MKRRAQTKERKGEDHGETSPSAPQWQDYHTEKEGDKKQCGRPSTKYRTLLFRNPNYLIYDGRANPIGHISHFRQSMALHLGNNVLMCRMFPSSLGPMSLRWFNRLQHSSIHSWDELAEAFVSRFITNSRKPKEFDSLMSMRMKDSESLKSYSARYWEVYNEVDGGTEDMAIKTFKQGLHPESELRHSLSKRPARSMQDLMSRIEQYVRVEEDRARTKAASTQSRPPRKPVNTE